MPFLIIILFTLGLYSQEEPSIHARMLEANRGVLPIAVYDGKAERMVPQNPEFTPIVNKKVFGYMPYWENTTPNLKYALLTDILFFSCELASGGALGDCHSWPSAAPIAEAHKYGINVHLVITGFDTATAIAMIKSSTQKSAFFSAAYAKVNDAGADGINIDFEISSGSDSAAIAQFFNELAEYFHSRDLSYIVSAALWAVDWQDTFDIGAMDKMDYFFIMAYDYHWKGGDPGPVAPLHSNSPWPSGGICVERSFNDYLAKLGGTHPEKLILGFPYYGYKWASTSNAIPGTKSANGTAVIYDTLGDYSAYPTAYDTGSDSEYKIFNASGWQQLWFDDKATLDKKYKFVNEKNAGGTGMWALNFDGQASELWAAIAQNLTAKVKGAKDDPVIIDKFPFEHTGNTYYYLSNEFNSYTCADTPNSKDIDESGPEVFYQFHTDCPGTVSIKLTAGEGSDSKAREDMDIHLLKTLSADDCLKRAHIEFTEAISAGDYFVSVDTYTASGTTMGGQYTVKIDFEGDDCAAVADDGEIVDDFDFVEDIDLVDNGVDEDSLDQDSLDQDSADEDRKDSDLNGSTDNSESTDNSAKPDSAEIPDAITKASSEGCGCTIIF